MEKINLNNDLEFASFFGGESSVDVIDSDIVEDKQSVEQEEKKEEVIIDSTEDFDIIDETVEGKEEEEEKRIQRKADSELQRTQRRGLCGA